MTTYVHEMFDHPATPTSAPGVPFEPHDYTVDQYECRGCHNNAHAQYHQDVTEEEAGLVIRDHPAPEIMPWSIESGVTIFLMEWHGRNDYCTLHEVTP